MSGGKTKDTPLDPPLKAAGGSPSSTPPTQESASSRTREGSPLAMSFLNSGGVTAGQSPIPEQNRWSPTYIEGITGVKLTHNQVAELNEAFRMLNLHGTAGQEKLAKEGITAPLLMDVMEHLGYHPLESEVADLIRNVDQTQGNNITFAEFLLLMTATMKEDHVADIRHAFRTYDKENTGYVSATQFAEMFANMGEKSSKEEVEELLWAADPNGTGKIEYNKFIDDVLRKVH